MIELSPPTSSQGPDHAPLSHDPGNRRIGDNAVTTLANQSGPKGRITLRQILSKRESDLGLREEALESITEAADLYRRLARARPVLGSSRKRSCIANVLLTFMSVSK
jgi:hypothetical protein